MKIDKVFTNMTQRIEDGFMEIECESMAVLRETDKEYADMQNAWWDYRNKSRLWMS